MKGLKISEEQEKRLLKMIKELFPCIEHLKINKNGIIYSEGTNYKVSINWHEMCWRILNKYIEREVISPMETTDIISIFGLVCFNAFESLHPIDWLYNKFYIKEQK